MHSLAWRVVVVLSSWIAVHALEQQVLIVPETQHIFGDPGAEHEKISASSGFQQDHYNSSNPTTGFIALGDSYSAGIGTGGEGKENDCRQGISAYPQLVAADRDPTAFQFLSCTGATTKDIMAGAEESQVDRLDVSLPVDFALLSIGGNDLGFFDVINACVFRFYNFYSGTCEDALARSRVLLESDEFEIHLRILVMEILDKIRWEKKPSFTITVTGYARFFNELTDGCEDMSFGVWWNGPKLTKKLRSDMNALVLSVNAKLRKTTDAINHSFTKDRLIFVDYDAEFDGHRFCEPNVIEPDYERLDTWFFLVGGPDNAGNGTKPQQTPDPKALSPTSPLVEPLSCLRPAQQSGDWGMLALCYMAMAKHGDPTLRLAREDVSAQNSMWYVPTYYGKTFHPRARGHKAIRDNIYKVWRTVDEVQSM
ncbi:SGNH hydrolase [Xylaria bambusicola]|uniref:SGNH hydrolase n=1 Tax=Xylaria bambusicola TaxID=326684 RepID=UPI00200817A2|nr:SGNH hydrolase [Xylaria bambusicola]KAI0526637.1 SGNH hydrolase [Xylaria bambusicola]